MKIRISDEKTTVLNAAEHIGALLEAKPEAVIALTAGRSTRALYRALGEMKLDFGRAKIFLVTEYSDPKYPDSCRAIIERELIDSINIKPENVFCPQSENCEVYDALIAEHGGIDLAVLGVGLNGHIGYNEPSTQFETFTRISRLTKQSREHISEDPPGPEKTVTMGIKTICMARDIMLLAFGEEKAEIVFKAVYGRTDSLIPAAFLQIPLQVTLYLDTAAAAKL